MFCNAFGVLTPCVNSYPNLSSGGRMAFGGVIHVDFGPKARNMTAQGNALGKRHSADIARPERAQQRGQSQAYRLLWMRWMRFRANDCG